MNYLDQLDRVKRIKCGDLTAKDKIRTGYRTKKQLHQGLATFMRYIPNVDNPEQLQSILFPDNRDKIRMGYKLNSGNEQIFSILDDGVSDNSLNGSYFFLSDSDDAASISSLGVDPEELLFNDLPQVQYERDRYLDGTIPIERLRERLQELREGYFPEVELAVDENMQPYAVRNEFVARSPVTPLPPNLVAQPAGVSQTRSGVRYGPV